MVLFFVILLLSRAESQVLEGILLCFSRVRCKKRLNLRERAQGIVWWSELMTAANKRVLIGFVTVVVVFAIASETYRAHDRRACERIAQSWRSKAMADKLATGVTAEARQWLETNGFRVFDWDPHGSHSYVNTIEVPKEGILYVVEGELELHRGNWLLKPAWIHLQFAFDRESRIHGIDASVWEVQDLMH